jgi:hypothetical protein
VWLERFAALYEADGEEWDRLHERLEEDWKSAYRAAFVELALRRGWKREHADDWAGEICGEAFLSASSDQPEPRDHAAADVVQCEMEVDDA